MAIEKGHRYKITTKEGHTMKVRVTDPPKEVTVRPGMVWIEKEPSGRQFYSSKTEGLRVSTRGWTDPNKHTWKELRR